MSLMKCVVYTYVVVISTIGVHDDGPEIEVVVM